MKPPRKITVEILTNDYSNADAILALLEVCRWLHNGHGNCVTENDTTTVALCAKYGARVDLQTCSVCGKYQPVVTNVCFGCIALDVRQALGRENPDTLEE